MKRFPSLFFFGLLLGSTLSTRGETIEWLRQFGNTRLDASRGVSADGMGNVYISGVTRSGLTGQMSSGDDAFLSKYDAFGSQLWIRQFGPPVLEEGRAVSADGLGNVYIAGDTDGALGSTHFGSRDAFVRKYDAGGNILWTNQVGTSRFDQGFGVSADGLGNVYITGITSDSLGGPHAGGYDAFVSKFDAAGSLLWTRQLGTEKTDFGRSVSADGLGHVYISGDLGSDAFVSKYDDAGDLLWTRQFGTPRIDEGWGVSADGLGNVFITGQTDGSLGGPNAGPAGFYDAFVVKYDDAGNLLWTRQLGTTRNDISTAVSADGLGNVYFSGITSGGLSGPSAGGSDAFVGKYDTGGNLLWTRQLGTTTTDEAWGVSADGRGNVYFSGTTAGNLGGPNAGGAGPFDVFVAKISDPAVPEPSTLFLTIGALVALSSRRRRALTWQFSRKR